MSWYEQIESNVLTYVKAMLKKRGYTPRIVSVIEKAAVDENGVPKHFPTVYLHALELAEAGNDLENTDTNAVLSTIEVQVFSNDYEECQTLRSEIVDIMKALRFSIPMLPTMSSRGDYYVSIARYRRIIGSCDTELITQ